MNRRKFLTSLFKTGPTIIAVPIVGPNFLERFLTWFRRKCQPLWGFSMPVVQRIWPQFCAKEFISVQPMSLPSAKVFYLDFVCDGKKETYDHLPLSTEPVEVNNDWIDYKE